MNKFASLVVVVIVSGCSSSNTPTNPTAVEVVESSSGVVAESDSTSDITSDVTINTDTSDPVSPSDPVSTSDPASPSDPVSQIVNDSAELLPFNLLDQSQDLVNSIAGVQLEQLANVIDDFAFIAEQTTTILWPDTDYRQVLNPSSFASVCDGGAECNVVPGEYILVNQASGKREDLSVPYIDPADLPDATQLPDTVYLVEDAVEGIVEMSVDRKSHNCDVNGTMIKETGNQLATLSRIGQEGSTGRVWLTSYHFNQCRVTIRDGLLPDGIYELEGHFQYVLSRQFRFNVGETHEFIFDDFSITGDDGLQYRVQAEATVADGNEGFLNSRAIEVIEYQKTLPNGDIAERLENVQFNFNSTFVSTPFDFHSTLDVDGVYRSLETSNQRVFVSTEPTMVRRKAQENIVAEGQIEILAEDGSFVYITPNPYIDPNVAFWRAPLLVDLDFTPTSGEQIQSDRIPQMLLTTARDCGNEYQIRRIETTGRLECGPELSGEGDSYGQSNYTRPIIAP